MTPLAQVMTGVRSRLASISGLNAHDISPGQITPPAAIVRVPPINYRETFQRGVASLPMTVTVLVSSAMDQAGQLKLAAYASPTGADSIIAAIEGDKTLGGVVSDCIVWDFRPLGLDEVGEIGYFGGVFNLRVALPGT